MQCIISMPIKKKCLSSKISAYQIPIKWNYCLINAYQVKYHPIIAYQLKYQAYYCLLSKISAQDGLSSKISAFKISSLLPIYCLQNAYQVKYQPIIAYQMPIK